jgi:hypothetical protein
MPSGNCTVFRQQILSFNEVIILIIVDYGGGGSVGPVTIPRLVKPVSPSPVMFYLRKN